eukprot:1194662-Prorocentrum_minimum.AAC.3
MCVRPVSRQEDEVATVRSFEHFGNVTGKHGRKRVPALIGPGCLCYGTMVAHQVLLQRTGGGRGGLGDGAVVVGVGGEVV